MHQQIKFLRDIIEAIDNNQETSLLYYTGDTKYRPSGALPPLNVRWLMIEDSLHKIEHHMRQSGDCTYVDQHVKEIIEKLSNKYTYNQHLCWKLHEHHFHVNFQSYVNCPFTCLSEISEYLEKLQKELYHT